MDVIKIDNFITVILKKRIELYKNLKHYKPIFENLLNNHSLGGKIHSDLVTDLCFIEDLKFGENILFLYKLNTSSIIKEYLNIMRTPIKHTSSEYYEKKKQQILTDYLNKIKLCIPCEFFSNINSLEECEIFVDNLLYCENCENKEEFIREGEILVCKKCFSEIIKMAYYNNRAYNISVSKCSYDRISHFKECMKQYQSKQNTFIHPFVYTNIESALFDHGIIGPPEEKDRFKTVKKSHIMYFLKGLGYTKHYDDCILIYTNLTGNKPNDISEIEEDLISDFSQISETYTLLYNNLERKNFINIQYILYLLLLKHKHPIEPEDFLSINLANKKIDRDEICYKIFETLGWEYKN